MTNIVPTWLDVPSVVVGGIVVEGVRVTARTVWRLVIEEKIQGWRQAKQSEEEWYREVDEALVQLSRGITDYRCGIIFKDPNRIEAKLDTAAETLYLQLRDPPDRIGESLREDLQDLAQSADTLAGVATDENELERGMEDFVGQADIAEYEERMDELARETHEKMVDVRNELNKAFA